MPLKTPNLDDRTYEEIIEEVKALIPQYIPEWTNYNPSDPGITLLELLSWISESLIYRTNIVPVDSYMNYLELIAGNGDVYDKTDKAYIRLLEFVKKIKLSGTKDVLEMKSEAQKFLSSRYRAVTHEDFEELALESSEKIKRAFVFDKVGKIEIVIVSKPDDRDNSLIKTVKEYLEPRRLIGTVIDVRFPRYTSLKLKVEMSCKSYADIDATKKSVEEKIYDHLDAIKGGPDKKGWPYGRNLMVYEIFHVIEKTEGVDNVISVIDASTNKAFKAKSIKELPVLDKLTIEVKE